MSDFFFFFWFQIHVLQRVTLLAKCPKCGEFASILQPSEEVSGSVVIGINVIGIISVLDLHFNPWVEASAGEL
jgi:hypothetical protein